MKTERRTAIFRVALGTAVLAVAALLAPQLRLLTVQEWVLVGSLVLLVALIQNFGVRVSYGDVTLMPVTALLAYFALGLEAGLAVITAGTVLSFMFRLMENARRPVQPGMPWWVRLGRLLWPIARSGSSLLAADWAFRWLGAVPPLVTVETRQIMLAVLMSPAVYLMVHDILLAVDLWLRGLEVLPTLIKNRIPLLAVQLLPLALAPFGAVALHRLGEPAFLILEMILLATAIVINRLTVTQRTLERQVDQLSTFSRMNETLRTTLEIDSLLASLYAQTASLLGVRNLHILLVDDSNARQEIRLAFASERGSRIDRDLNGRIDDFTLRVIEHSEPLLAESVEEIAHRLNLPHPPQVRSWMGVPLRGSKRLLGAITIWLETGEQIHRTFTRSDMVLFTAIGTQASVTLENALLYQSAQQHAAQLARLNQISTVMNASLNPERVLELISESVIEVAGCDKAAIYLLETETSDPSLLLTHAQGFSQEYVLRSRDIAVPLTDEERKQVMDEGKTLAVSNLVERPMGTAPLTMLLAQRENFAAYAYLPLRVQKQPIGMLAVYYDRPHRFSEGEIELLETFANQAALAVVNARVYQRVDVQLSKRVEQIVHMADINQRLTSTLNQETIFGLIIDSAMEGLQASRGVLVLASDPEQGQELGGLNMVAWRGFDPTHSLRMPHHVAEELANSSVLKNGKTLIVSGDDPTKPGPRSQLSVPIMVEGRAIGAIALESEVLNAFSTDDVTFVNQLAVQAAVAIRNAQLYKRAQMVRDRLHAILDASQDGLLMIDSKSRIVMTNARMGDFWDFAREDYTPRSPEQFIADPLTALGEGLGYREGELQAMLDRAMRTPNTRPTTDLYVTHGTATGRRQRFVERSVAPVHDEEGNFLGLLLIFRDISKQKELEQTREDLISMIVHDLRSPLQAVMGSMRLINEVVGKDQNPVVDQATSVSGRAVKKLLNLVNNLLDLSRLERGEFVLDPAPAEIRPVLEDAMQELMPLAQEMNAVIRVEVPEGLPQTTIDRDMIERVVLNLVDNALKYSPPGAVVTLRAKLVTGREIPGGASDESMIRVQVIDTGPGIPDEFKEMIFDRYTQIPGQKGRRASAGLGLAFCRLAVESHHGTIWVETNREAGKGSIFNFTLPLGRSQTKADVRLTAAAEPLPAPEPPESDDPLRTRTDFSVSTVRQAAKTSRSAGDGDQAASDNTMDQTDAPAQQNGKSLKE